MDKFPVIKGVLVHFIVGVLNLQELICMLLSVLYSYCVCLHAYVCSVVCVCVRACMCMLCVCVCMKAIFFPM